MECKRCSRENKHKGAFCSFCGAQLASGKKQSFLMRAEERRRAGEAGALQDLERVRGAEPGNHYASLVLGLCHEQEWQAGRDKGALEKARACYSDYLKVDFQSENVHQLYIGTYLRAGRLDEARRRYREYLELDPANELLQRCLKWIDISAGLDLSRPAETGEGKQPYRWLRLMANPALVALVLSATAFTVAGLHVILEEGSRGEVFWNSVIGLVFLLAAGYLFFAKKRD